VAFVWTVAQAWGEMPDGHILEGDLADADD
jgi:hypothetical protein